MKPVDRIFIYIIVTWIMFLFTIYRMDTNKASKKTMQYEFKLDHKVEQKIDDIHNWCGQILRPAE